MALSLIGAGFGRSGTSSMKLALETLGLGPCHHMSEVMRVPQQKALWRSIAGGATPSWDEAFAGYQSCVDWPSAFYWRELSAHYPNAKVILTVRDPDAWYESMASTIFRVLKQSSDPESVGTALIAKKVFAGQLDNRDHAIEVFQKNTAAVQEAIASERLLTFPVGSGWGPLCEFLGTPVPDAPFPRTNSREEFNSLTKSSPPPE